jgi:exopolysaccharide biosynthesis polyprenyl glycosylphosphotransferase
MPKKLEKILLIAIDLIMIHLTFFLWCRLRHAMGFFSQTSFWGVARISLVLFAFWYLLFVLYGNYRIWYTRSRIDEFIAIVKGVSIGVFIIFIITSDLKNDLSHPLRTSRLLILSYWALMIFFVGSGRVLLRTLHRRLLAAGIGHKKTLIVGWGKKAWELFDKVCEAPAMGYDVVGFVKASAKNKKKKHKEMPLVGKLDQLHQIIRKKDIQEILIALPGRSESLLQQVIAECDGTTVGLKIVPDLYDVIIGQVRTNQIYGFPLIEILPQLMQPWEKTVKRIIDIVFSLVMLIGFLPIGLIISALIRIESRGPVFYTQERVGKDGKIFKIIKFRSMVFGAEENTGPVWASPNDERVTKIGRILRNLRLDEVPQFINVLDGDMSLIGPRPERPYFVEKLRKAFPLYTRRLRIQPGITGWAQVKGEYDQSLDHVKQKLEYDLFYLENMSLRMDLKIIINTLYVMLIGKGH